MAMKKLRDLGYEDLGAAVRYEYDGDSVMQGNLESVSHHIGRGLRADGGFTSVKIDGVSHSSRDAESALMIYTVEEVKAEQSANDQ